MRNNYLKIGLFFVSALFFMSCAKEDINDLSDTFYVRHKGADMPAHIYGNASEKVFLILLHGGPGDSGLSYRFGTIKNRIEKSCAVVYFDQRGSGMSQGRFSENDFNIDVMTEDVMALVKVIQHKYGNDSRFFLMGHSWGGTLGIATLLKNNNQDFFKGWINVDGVHDWRQLYFGYIENYKVLSKEQIALGNRVDYWQKVLNKVKTVDPLKPNLEDFFKLNREAFIAETNIRRDGFIVSDDDYEKEIVNNYVFKNNLLTTFWSGAMARNVLIREDIFKNWSFEDRLNEIKIPSLLLWGKHDVVIPYQIGERISVKMGSKYKKHVLFEQSGHFPGGTESQKFADEVEAFISMNK
ncbi:alpha/beta hydrolase [Aquimarina sp. 2201CG1-2-11]|uniref:alpha/beta fold hydrolase n=1 Tax=Aquimarina discodermiae TaxID=3231043 RepID=UPI003462D9FB